MTGDRLNYLNVALILVSFALACLWPFELLVFSYAVLGPIHYLTEIPWLHKRTYFTSKGPQSWWLWLWGLSALAAAAIFLRINAGPGITFVAFLFALCLVVIKSTSWRMALLFGICASSALVKIDITFFLFFGIFLTTLIHVGFFTWQFMLYGCLKERRLSGLIALTVFTLLSAALLLGCYFPVHAHAPSVTIFKHAIDAFKDLTVDLAYILGLPRNANSYLAATRFIAFVYTYHYLNWFSKTRVIKWHEVNGKTLTVITLLYAGALMLYAVDFNAGLNAVLFLSLAHVYLEFPLNWRTSGAIVVELMRWVMTADDGEWQTLAPTTMRPAYQPADQVTNALVNMARH